MFSFLASASSDDSPSISLTDWMGVPDNYSSHGSQVDHLIEVVSWFMIALFIGWTLFFLFSIVRFHQSRVKEAQYHGVKNHYSTHVEIGVVIVEAVLLLGFALPLWSDRTDDLKTVNEQDPVRVRAIGYQFAWSYHYAGEDGVFGRIDRTLVSKAGDACLDPADPNGYDDFIQTGKMLLPVNRPAIVQVTSTDVIHNYSVIPMRIQQDAIPGTDIPMWFTPVKEIETYVVCGQLCGQGHADMIGTMAVMPEAEFDEWHKAASDKSKATSIKEEAARIAQGAKDTEAREKRVKILKEEYQAKKDSH